MFVHCWKHAIRGAFVGCILLPGTQAIAAPPSSSPDAFQTNEDTPLISAAPGVLENDTDPDGEAYLLVAELVEGPKNGTLKLDPEGSFVYTPAANFSGVDNFTYRASDGRESSAVTPVMILIQAVNNAPKANDDAYTLNEDELFEQSAPGVLGNDRDPESDTLGARVTDWPKHGTLEPKEDGGFSYTPNAEFVGEDHFKYLAFDGELESSEATVLLSVMDTNDAPLAQGDAYVAEEEVALKIAAQKGVLANDSDPDGDPITAVLARDPSHGVLSMSEDGAFVYKPEEDFIGTDRFAYQTSDPSGAASVAVEVEITVNAGIPEFDVFNHGFRVGYSFFMNHDCSRNGETGTCRNESELNDVKSPHFFLIGYELMQRLRGASWLNIIFIENLTIGGLEQSLFIPSLNLMLGFEFAQQVQFGAGISIIPTSKWAHAVLALGWTPRVGAFWVPVHFIFIPDVDSQHRVGFTAGINW